MPKTIIKEYDNSIPVVTPSSNFAVVVPGYLGTPADGHNLEDILIADKTYRVASQADFIKYIGKKAGEKVQVAPPDLELIDATEPTHLKYILNNTLALTDFIEGYKDRVYAASAVVDIEDPKYGKNGYLVKTFTAVETGAAPLTYKFVKITKVDDITWNENIAQGTYCVLNTLGTDSISDSHKGNQIAYMLTGLGYEVLFKAINEAEPLSDQLDNLYFWESLRDKSIFRFRYIMTGGYYNAAAMNQICALANFDNTALLETADTYGNITGRGDVIALCDIDETNVNKTTTTHNLITTLKDAIDDISANNKYSAIFAPSVTYKLVNSEVKDFAGNQTFPASFHYLACASKAFERYKEWYAVAGYTRGVSPFAINSVTIPFGEIAVNTLAPRIANDYATKAVNLILSERGNYYLWGNRTAATLEYERGLIFSDFLNIRQLCTTIKQVLYTACRQFTFDPNSDLLWVNFVSAIKPTLEVMKADAGIRGYVITRTTNNKKAVLTANLRIIPIEAVEDFDISIYLEDSIAGLAVTAAEAE